VAFARPIGYSGALEMGEDMRATCLGSLLPLILSPHFLTGLGAQTVIEIRDPPTCDFCTITMELELAIGGSEAPGVGPIFNLARDTRGRWLVNSSVTRGEVGVYGANGDYLRTVGRFGQGPGEFRALRQIIPFGDSISMFDLGNTRETVFDEVFQVIRTNPLPYSFFSVLFLDDSTRVFNFSSHTPEKVGHPLHIVDVNGEISRSFGYEGGVYRRDFAISTWRVLNKSGQGAFWAGRFNEYVIEKWTQRGEKVVQIERLPSWFKPYQTEEPLSLSKAPNPFMMGVWEDPEGLLWTAVIVPDPKWRDALSRSPGGELRVGSHHGFLDTIVEVMDPTSGNLIASQRFDLFFEHFTPEGLLTSYREADNGLPFIDIWRVTLIQDLGR